MQPATTEFSPTYNTRQRILHMACALLWAVPAIALSLLYVLPWAEQVADKPCELTLGLPNALLLWYGVFGFASLFISYLGLYWGTQGFRVLRSGQHPAAGVRTYSPMPVRRGRSARRIGSLQLLALALPLIILPLAYNALSEQQTNVSSHCSQASQTAAP